MLKYDWKTIGHISQKKQIEQKIKEKNVPHALLFSGPHHIGKSKLSKELASLLFFDAIQTIPLSHPDFIIIDQLYIQGQQEDWSIIAKSSNFPQNHRAKSPAIKTNTITISDIREIQSMLLHKPIQSKYKICVIHNIERMNREATNAFLKTVEEPPSYVKFIFTTSKEGRILPTLLSRLHTISFHHLPKKQMDSLVNHPQKEKIIHYAQGRVGIALKMMQSDDFYQEIHELYSELHNVFQPHCRKIQLQFSEKTASSQKNLDEFFEHAYFYLRSQIETNQNIGQIVTQLEITEQQIKSNTNKQLSLDAFFLNIENFL